MPDIECGPCEPWPIARACWPDDWNPDDPTPEQQECLCQAQRWLTEATNGIWGNCPVTAEYCPPLPGPACTPGICGCPTLCRFTLEWPARGPISLSQHGTALNTIHYIDSYQTLYVTDGCPSGCAPVIINYRRGFPVTPGSQASIAFTKLALEICRNPCFLAECGLPVGTEQVTRDNMTIRLNSSIPNATITAVNDLVAYTKSRFGRPYRVTTLDEPEPVYPTYPPPSITWH